MRLKLTGKIIRITPRPFQLFLKRLGFQRALDRIISKSEGELIFQTAWAERFNGNEGRILEFWRKYRCLDEIKKFCRFADTTKVLDVGCGISSVLHFVGGERYGIDPLAGEYLKFYCYPKDVVIKEGAGEAIPFPNHYFDVVFCSNVLDHTEDPRRVVGEILRVLKKAAVLFSRCMFLTQILQGIPPTPSPLQEKMSFLQEKMSFLWYGKSFLLFLRAKILWQEEMLAWRSRRKRAERNLSSSLKSYEEF